MTDRGSMLPLAAGLVALSGVAIVGIIDATDLALTRANLQSDADMAALVAAESFDPFDATFDGRSVMIRLTDLSVRRSTRRFLRDTQSAATIVAASAPDGRSAVVTLRTAWTPPLGSEFFPAGMTITTTATARTVLGG